MLPEAARDAADRAAGLWTELETAYDAIDTHLAAGRWPEIEQEARRLDELQGALAPLLSVLAAARAGAKAGSEIDRTWSAMAERGCALAERRRAMERRVLEARDAVQSDLARARRGRTDANRYRAKAVPPRFTSRRA